MAELGLTSLVFHLYGVCMSFSLAQVCLIHWGRYKIMTILKVFKGEVYSFQIIIIIIITAVSAFFIYGNDPAKWDGSLEDLHLAHCLSNSKESCISRLSLNKLGEHNLFSPLNKALQKSITIRNTEKQTKQQPLCHLYQVYSSTGHSSRTSRYTLGCSGQGIC